jgi:hypothetical protein
MINRIILGEVETWKGPGVTNQLLQEEKGCTHKGVTKWKREVVGVVTVSSMLPKQFLKNVLSVRAKNKFSL